MDPRLAIFCVVEFMFTLAIYIPIDFLPQAMVEEHGISHTNAGYIIAFYGISSMVGPIISGIATKYLNKRAILVTSLCMCVSGCCCVGMAFSVVYWQFVVCCFIYGLSVSEFFVLLPISLIEMFGIESLKISYSIMTFCGGFATLLGPPMAGW